ncbi:YdcF family protein [Vibrio parahaemolyticus]|uniref:YdcF family protein n=1 Tax=Vibrio parahaemolyticus TaxID=670 RepID=UPI00111F6335|nr:YdcF family protein [Vibrio parahaemolyticus]ELA8085760.1 YdcF family protein [Vibrio parahaemolyticus]ELA8202429.1 YdcF family protein [Vibrio parahaemolyticus]ELB2026681.1 YdcF family protein [Vibrio parahaemolyticus]ELB2138652.1 YdcF family protein [Vibrio parahaemolyticus]ELB2216368.1 YdcF family protein [Vibrio parahaemolyticus]
MKLYQHIETLWDYMHLKQDLKPADCLFVMCSNDVRVAEYAAALYHQKLAPLIVFSGGEGRFTDGLFEKSEAETFADIARLAGVPSDAILVETRSTNSGENVRFTEQLLKEKGIQCESIILVQKPFMERRAIATFEKQWQSPYSRVQVSSTAHPFFEYINEDMPLMMVLEALMEDFSRVKSYPEKGFQTKQDIPNQVDSSYQVLLERFGFDLV